jgi:excisionase family DNA binding protein
MRAHDWEPLPWQQFAPKLLAVLLSHLRFSPRQACLLLGVGNTRLYQLIGAGELEAYHEGRARRITMRSIRERVARLAATTDDEPTPRPRGRLPKIAGGVGDESDTSPRRRTLPNQSDGQLEEAGEPATVLARPRANSSAKRVQR